MDSAIAGRLLDLNRRFYTEHARDFSATRARLQEGVTRLLKTLRGDESILDLGCGNGELARTLSRRGQRGPYLGLDFSLPLLEEAGRASFAFPVKFAQVDLTSSGWSHVVARSGASGATTKQSPRTSKQEIASNGLDTAEERRLLDHPGNDMFDIVFAFAVLHHIPGVELRLNIVRKVHDLLGPTGLFIHSNWQFLNSLRLKARIQPWDRIGLTAGDVDADDYLLDWKRGGVGLRYVHHFAEAELAELAKASGFEILEKFYSDGESNRLGLYQVWRKAIR